MVVQRRAEGQMTYLLNYRDLPPCETPSPGPSSNRLRGDGGHRWDKPVRLGRCWNSYTCLDCGVKMEVDTSD